MDIRSILILSILFFAQLGYAYDEQDVYLLFNTTFTYNSSKLRRSKSIISFIDVDVPDSSLDHFAQILEEVKDLNLYRSALSRLYIPTGLLKLNIENPVNPMEIVITPNESYSLKEIKMMSFHKLPTQISHLQSLEHFTATSTHILELDFELFAKMENLTTINMVNTSTKDIILSKRQQFPKFRVFSCWDNNLTTLNVTSWNFPSLEALDLSYNNFTILPQQIATFGNLTDLNMRGNQLKTIDMHTFSALRRLVILDLQNNHISSIIGELQLPKLALLRLDMNHLVELDVSQWYLPILDYVNLCRNLLKSVVGFTKCFSGTTRIDLTQGQWNCSWLQEVGRSIKGMVITTIQHNSSTQYCHGKRLN